MKVAERIEIALPQEEVFEVVADLRDSPRWQASLERVDLEGPVEVGAAGTELRRIAGQRRESRFEVVVFEPPRVLALESASGPIRARASFRLSGTAEGTRVDFEVDVELRGRARFAGPMVRAAAGREARDNLRRLRDLLES